MILQAVWGPAYGTETQYLRVYASQLRKKLHDDPTAPRLVTEPGVGYRVEKKIVTGNGAYLQRGLPPYPGAQDLRYARPPREPCPPRVVGTCASMTCGWSTCHARTSFAGRTCSTGTPSAPTRGSACAAGR